MSTYLAADFGGGSGRIMAGTLTEGKLKLEEVYRFANRQIKLGNCVYWDFLSLFEEMKNGLRVAARKGYEVKSMAIDTWGVDFSVMNSLINLFKHSFRYTIRTGITITDRVAQQLTILIY